MQEQVTVFFARSRLQLAERFASARLHRRVAARTHCYRRVHVCYRRAAVPPPVIRADLSCYLLRGVHQPLCRKLRPTSCCHCAQCLISWNGSFRNTGCTYIVMLTRVLQSCIDNFLQARVAPSISVSNLQNNATAVQDAPAPISLPSFMSNYTAPAPLAVADSNSKKSSASTFHLLPQLLLICVALLAL